MYKRWKSANRMRKVELLAVLPMVFGSGFVEQKHSVI